MSKKNWLWWIVEAILWYVWIYFFLYTIKNNIDISVAALILLIIGYLATLSCPWFRNTGAWQRLTDKEPAPPQQQ